ncbi:hypothetical protein BV898_03526 [Hypsibius exemplaris]|uniref:WAP domain-containing protein n=1 Tax=Hypsibius exemplaris TaxID=2072580 RepID=A0A1W0X5M3_HYPEX|nr:hypothetical protein BV898_03526 [Hypsibius exemplaris]
MEFQITSGIAILVLLLLEMKQARSCTFLDPCTDVKCPESGQQCDWIFPYCNKHVCPPVATCSDPCKDLVCQQAVEECVVVADSNCKEPLCRMSAQCNARTRPGNCPDEPRFLTSCAAQCVDDHLCPKNYKCCNGFCIAPIL